MKRLLVILGWLTGIVLFCMAQASHRMANLDVANNFTQPQSAALLDKGGMAFNVQATGYGAKGDNYADDTAAINSAKAAAKAAHGILFLPAGTYKITSALDFTNITGMIIQGAGQPGSAFGYLGQNQTSILYAGPNLGTKCVVEMTKSSLLQFRDIGFGLQGSSTAACILMMAGGGAESAHNTFSNVSIGGGTASTVAAVANCGSELDSWTNNSHVSFGSAGYLGSTNGCSGYGLASNFGYTFDARSTSMHNFSQAYFIGNGSGNAFQFDGSSSNFINTYCFGCFFNTGGGAAFQIDKGTTQGLTVIGARFEDDLVSGTANFVNMASNTTLLNSMFTDYTPQTNGATLNFFNTASSPSVVPIVTNMLVSGQNVSMRGTVGITELELYDGLNLNISLTGATSSLFGTVSGAQGVTNLSPGTGPMRINLWNGQQYYNGVVWWVNLGAGTSTYTLGSPANVLNAHMIGRYLDGICEFQYKTTGGGSETVGTVSSIAATLGTLSCPSAGTGASAPTISATYSATGGVFMVEVL